MAEGTKGETDKAVDIRWQRLIRIIIIARVYIYRSKALWRHREEYTANIVRKFDMFFVDPG